MWTSAAKRMNFWRVMRPVSGAVFLLLVSFLVALAATTTGISLNDLTIDDWQTAGIPIFVTDPEGDVDAPEYDIINGSVATSVTVHGQYNILNFMVQTAGGVTSIPSGNHIVIASLDCDNDGVDQEPEDYLIFFMPTQDSTNVEGTTALFDGTGNSGITLESNTGQRIEDRVEWGARTFWLTPPASPIECSQTIGIRFLSAYVWIENETLHQQILDQTEMHQYNVPTVVELQEFNAASGFMNGPLPIGLAVAVVAGILLFAQRLRTRRD